MQNPNSYSGSNNANADDTLPESTAHPYSRREWNASRAQGQTQPYQPTQAQSTQAYTSQQRKAVAAQNDYLTEQMDHEAFPETHPQPRVSASQTSYRQVAASSPSTQRTANRLSQVDDSQVAGRVAYDNDGNLVVVKKEEKSSPIQMAAIVGSALSAVTSAFFSSHIGIGGSVLTVAIGAAVSAAATQLYTHLIKKSTDTLKHVTKGSGHQQLDGVMDSSQLDGGYGYGAEAEAAAFEQTYVQAATQAEDDSQARRIRRRGVIIVAIVALVAVIVAAGVVTLATNGEGIGTKTPSIITTTQTTDTTDDNSDATSTDADKSDAADTTKQDQNAATTTTNTSTTTDEGTTSGTSTSGTSTSGTSGTSSTSGTSTSGTGTSTNGNSGTSTDSGNGGTSTNGGSTTNNSGTGTNSSTNGNSGTSTDSGNGSTSGTSTSGTSSTSTTSSDSDTAASTSSASE